MTNICVICLKEVDKNGPGILLCKQHWEKIPVETRKQLTNKSLDKTTWKQVFTNAIETIEREENNG